MARAGHAFFVLASSVSRACVCDFCAGLHVARAGVLFFFCCLCLRLSRALGTFFVHRARWRWLSLAGHLGSSSLLFKLRPCNSPGQERASSFASLESHSMATSFGSFDLNVPVLEDEDGNGGFDLNELPLETGNGNVS